MPKHYETAAHVIAASVALPVVDILAVALKFKVRRIQKQPLKADDWSLVPATVRRFSSLILTAQRVRTSTNVLLLAQFLTSAIGIVLSYGATNHHAIGWPLEIPPDSEGGPTRPATEQEMLARKVWRNCMGVEILANTHDIARSNMYFFYCTRWRLAPLKHRSFSYTDGSSPSVEERA